MLIFASDGHRPRYSIPKVGNVIKEHKNDYRYHSAFESGSIIGVLCTEGIPTVKSPALGLLPYSDSAVVGKLESLYQTALNARSSILMNLQGQHGFS